MGWTHILEKLQLPYRLYSHCKLPDEIAHQLNCIPCFMQEPEKGHYSDPVIGKLKSLIKKADIFKEGLAFIGKLGISTNDLIIVTYAMEAEILGTARWLEYLPENCRPKIAFISHRSSFEFEILDDGKKLSHDQLYYGYASDQFRQVCPESRNAMFTANCPNWCSLLKVLTGLRVYDGPHHMFYDTVTLNHVIPLTEHEYDVGIMGIFRPEKGSELLPDVVRKVCQRRPQIRFFLQINKEDDIPDLEQWRDSLPSAHSVTIKIGGIPMDEYRNILQKTSIQLLAYFWKSYFMRHSGVFSDAAAFGKPMVVPGGSLLESMLERYALSGEIFKYFEPDSIAEAVVQAYDKRETMTETSLAQVTNWRSKNSVSECFLLIADKLNLEL